MVTATKEHYLGTKYLTWESIESFYILHTLEIIQNGNREPKIWMSNLMAV